MLYEAAPDTAGQEIATWPFAGVAVTGKVGVQLTWVDPADSSPLLSIEVITK
jgi:hypothetical protein